MADQPPTLADEILDAVEAAGRPMSPKDVHEALGGSYLSIRSTLLTMRDRDQLTQPRRGRYALPEPPEPPRRTEEELWQEHDPDAHMGNGEPGPLYVDGEYCPYYVPGTDGRPLFGVTAGFTVKPVRSEPIRALKASA